MCAGPPGLVDLHLSMHFACMHACPPQHRSHPAHRPRNCGCLQARNGSIVCMAENRVIKRPDRKDQKGRWRGLDADMDTSDDQVCFQRLAQRLAAFVGCAALTVVFL